MDSYTATPPVPAPDATAPSGSVNALRLVLFGRPATGKSSLLGALAEAARCQSESLGAELIDQLGGLSELCRQLYESGGRLTTDEIVRHPIQYGPCSAALLDCDGRIANDLLQAECAPDHRAPRGSLAREVTEADALLLITDASADANQLDADFAEFERFLSLMEATRGERTEVGGLPVYLVLTKCDLLARATDNPLDWRDRIEQRKREVGDRFRDFLSSHTPDDNASSSSSPDDAEGSPNAGFGSIDLVVWATAVKRPTLLGATAKPREPYGVAELFRQALESAQYYRASADRSRRRLMWMLSSVAILLLGFLFATVLLLLVSRGVATTRLQALAEELLFTDRETPAQRLRGNSDQLRRRLEKFLEVRNDSEFSSLPERSQDWIESRYHELKNYLAYYDKLLQQPSPASQRTLEGLDDLISQLEDKSALAPPPLFVETPAAAFHQRMLNSAREIRTAADQARAWYFNSSQQALRLEELQDVNGNLLIDWPEWAREVDALLAQMPPLRPDLPLPFREVITAQARWETTRARLRALLDVCTALGRVPDRPGRDMLKVYARFPLAQAREHLARLRSEFPDYAKSFNLQALPPGGREVVAKLARPFYDNLIECGRSEVLRQLQRAGKGKEETHARWKPVRDWLADPSELRDWNELALVFLRLQKSDPVSPTQELAAFLAKDQFLIEFRSADLTIPRRLAPARSDETWAEWTVWHKDRPELVFRLKGKPIEDAGMVRPTRYVYELSKGQRIVFIPGERFEARLPLAGGRRELVWAESRSQLYPFECLLLPPREVNKGAAFSTGLIANAVKLELRGEAPVPPLPDLLPRVRLED